MESKVCQCLCRNISLCYKSCDHFLPQKFKEGTSIYDQFMEIELGDHGIDIVSLCAKQNFVFYVHKNLIVISIHSCLEKQKLKFHVQYDP